VSQPSIGSAAGSAANALGSGAKGLAKVAQGFKDFVSRGNAVDLAVGVVIGAAFGAVVKSIVDNLINPLIGWIFGQPNLDNVLAFGPAGKDEIRLGAIVTAFITFLLTAAAVYFIIVLPLNALAARRKRGEETEPAAPAEDILLLQEIRDLLAQRPSPAVQADVTNPPTIRPQDGPPAPPTA